MSNGERGDGSSGARITHVHRIFKDNDPKSDTWVDVERIDELHLMISGTQRVQYVFNWDLLEATDYTGPTKTIADPHDENSKIDIPVREIVHVVGPKGRVAHQFVNDQSNQSRQTHSRRIYHHEIKDSYLDEDGQPPRDSYQYLNALGSQDKDQFIDVEILDAYSTSGYDRNDIHGFPLMLADGVTQSPIGRHQHKIWDAKTDDPFMNDPLVPGDEAGGTPVFMLLYNPNAGPKIDPPWRLDPLQNIVNVSWGGATIFVAAGNAEMIVYGKFTTKNDAKKSDVFKLINTPPDFVGEVHFLPIMAGSYRRIKKEGEKDKSIFVLGGMDESEDGRHSWGIIMTSPDGKNWTRAAKIETHSETGLEEDEAAVQALVWDDAFYAHVSSTEYYYSDPDGFIIQSNLYDKLWKSTNGTDWAEIGTYLRHNTEGSPPPNYAEPPLFIPHTDQNPANLPDGTFGYHELRDQDNQITESFLAVPNSPSHYWLGYTNIEGSYDGKQPSKSIDITILKDGVTTKTSKTTPIYVNGIAYANGILMVGGRTDDYNAAVAASTDQGDTWNIVWIGEEDWMQEIWVIIAAEAPL